MESGERPVQANNPAEATTPGVDASFKLSISHDELEAYLNLQPAQGAGQRVTKPEVLAKLAEIGIIEGIKPDAIEAALASGSAQGLVVAQGRPASDGRDGWLEPLVPEVNSRIPHVDASGHTDYRDLGAILTVHPGDALLTRHAPTEGVAGMTVRGAAIAAKPGKVATYASSLPGTEFAPENPDLLRAAITGQPVIVRGGVMVEPVYKVEAVNAATGNVDFDGSVIVSGDVSAGMTVRATGDIQIGGIVEIATLEAGGNIAIKGGAMGALGHKGGTPHSIRCQGSFSAAYAQQAKIEAGDSIFIDDVAMQCELVALNHIRIGKQKRGHIIGGVLQATLSITGKVVGSPNRVRTRLDIGVNPAMHKQLLEMAKDRDAKETQLLEVSKLLAFAQKNPGKLRPEMIEKANATYTQLWEAIAVQREEQDALTQKIELSQGARVIAEQAIYEGVEVVLGNQHYRVAGEHGACVVTRGQGGLGIYAADEVA